MDRNPNVIRRQRIEQMLKQEPEDVFLNFGLAMELVKEQALADAIRQFARVLTLDPDYTAAHYHKAATHIKLHQPVEARETLLAGIAAARRIGNAHAEREMQELLAGLGSV